jgi:hypothetical protein
MAQNRSQNVEANVSQDDKQDPILVFRPADATVKFNVVGEPRLDGLLEFHGPVS